MVKFHMKNASEIYLYLAYFGLEYYEVKRGMTTSRMGSYEGEEYKGLRHRLTPEQRRQNDTQGKLFVRW